MQLIQEPLVDPDTPTQPTAEPTPESPAPTQTSPVTPDPGKRSPSHLWLLLIAVILFVAALIFLLLSPWSPFAAALAPERLWLT